MEGEEGESQFTDNFQFVEKDVHSAFPDLTGRNNQTAAIEIDDDEIQYCGSQLPQITTGAYVDKQTQKFVKTQEPFAKQMIDFPMQQNVIDLSEEEHCNQQQIPAPILQQDQKLIKSKKAPKAQPQPQRYENPEVDINQLAFDMENNMPSEQPSMSVNGKLYEHEGSKFVGRATQVMVEIKDMQGILAKINEGININLNSLQNRLKQLVGRLESKIKPLIQNLPKGKKKTLSLVKNDEDAMNETKQKIDFLQKQSEKNLRLIENNAKNIKLTLEKFYNSHKSIVAKKDHQAESNSNSVKIIPKKATNKSLKPYAFVKHYYKSPPNQLGEVVQYEKLLASEVNGNLLFLSHLHANKTDVLAINPSVKELQYYSQLSKKVNYVVQQQNRIICEDLIYQIDENGIKLLHQIQFPFNTVYLQNTCKPTCVVAIGQEYLLYGMSKYGLLYLYKFDKQTKEYVIQTRSQDKSNKALNQGVTKIAINQYLISNDFGNEQKVNHKHECEIYSIVGGKACKSIFSLKAQHQPPDSQQLIQLAAIAAQQYGDPQLVYSNPQLMHEIMLSISAQQTVITMRPEISQHYDLMEPIRGNKLIDFKLITQDKMILLYCKHLVVIDTNTKEQMLTYNSIYFSQSSIILFNERAGGMVKSNEPQDLQVVTVHRMSKTMYVENTVSFDYGPVTGFQANKNVERILGETVNGNLICIAPSETEGGGIQILRIEKYKKIPTVNIDDDGEVKNEAFKQQL